MSIAVLNQVYEETRRLAIAGSNLARDDFRLKKLVEPLQKSAAKAPVFGQVAQLVTQLIESPEKDSPQALLDLGSLVTAILYTQGETDAPGKLQDIQLTELNVSTTQTSARLLKPLIEALTTTGSGRLSTIRESFELGAFQDLRLVNYSVKALDDKHKDIAEYIDENVLPLYGKSIIPLIKDKIKIKGTGGSVRRLKALYRLAPEAARPIILEAFENGSKEMKMAALSCLGDDDADLPHLQEQAKARSKEVRKIAFERLVPFSDDATIELYSNALSSKDRSIVSWPISQTKSKKLVDIVLAKASATLESIQEETASKKLGAHLDCFQELIPCFTGRKAQPVLEFLAETFQKRNEIFPTKPDFASTVDEIESELSFVMLSTMDRKLMKILADAYRELNLGSFAYCLFASRIVCKPVEVYQRFVDDYTAQPKGKSKKMVADRRDTIRSQLNNSHGRHLNLGRQYYDWIRFDDELESEIKKSTWDPQWLEAAIEQDHLDVVCQLATSKSKKINAYIDDRFSRNLKNFEAWNLSQLIELALDCNYNKATDMVIQVLQKSAQKTNHYLAYNIGSLISRLDANSYEKIEAVVKTLPENVIDWLMPHLQTLQAKKV